mgnify:CR=1 FL=1
MDNALLGSVMSLVFSDDFYENHLNEYSIQLSMYAAILEEWGFEIGGAYLVHIGPGEEDAQMYKVVDMRDNIKKFFGA